VRERGVDGGEDAGGGGEGVEGVEAVSQGLAWGPGGLVISQYRPDTIHSMRIKPRQAFPQILEFRRVRIIRNASPVGQGLAWGPGGGGEGRGGGGGVAKDGAEEAVAAAGGEGVDGVGVVEAEEG
jgi:hypothetical protein